MGRWQGLGGIQNRIRHEMFEMVMARVSATTIPQLFDHSCVDADGEVVVRRQLKRRNSRRRICHLPRWIMGNLSRLRMQGNGYVAG
jgi:hypothetical protein